MSQPLIDSVALLAALEESGSKLVIVATGGGSQAIPHLLTTPGASGVVLECLVPYAREAVDRLLGGPQEGYCSSRAARRLAVMAWQRACGLGAPPGSGIGVAVTASLRSRAPKRGQHRIVVAMHGLGATSVATLVLRKEARSRADEEMVAAALLLERLASFSSGCRSPLAPSLLQLLDDERLEIECCEPPVAWQELLAGSRTAVHAAVDPSRPRPAAAPASAPPARPAQLAAMINQGGGFVPPVPGVGFGSFKVPPYRPNAGDQVVPFTRRRRITADHMTYSKLTSPHVVTVAEIDLFRAAKLREANKERYKKEGLSLTMLAFVVVATARALRENPSLNSRVLDDAFVIHKDVNIGVAVDSPDGLVVPVVRRADELGVRGIVRSIDDVAKRARNGKITADDLSGSTFSVSNPGLKGNLFGGAIISQPNVGILRMGEIQKRVVVVESPDGEDQMAIHPIMYMALSYDHRVVDGVAANAFLWRVTEILEKAEFEV
jgi:pyruvate/2-oxoglutarate dehydrogenase complex dihydrolipoamide acyltransferase (E2) component